ncbi:MAG TPA: CocE/NonD family hydrolase, partial [Pseudonocardiaceae bacterium]
MSLTSRLAGRLLGLPAVRTPAVQIERDLNIPADEGVQLLADRYYPASNPTAPLVLIRTPYGRRSANILIARLFAERGYQVLIQALRGTDGSGGTFDGFTLRRADGPATIRWLRRQDWFPGAFATWGASYLGYAQWDLASTPIPEWKLAVIDVAPASFYHNFMYPGGAFALGNALGWAQLVQSLFGRSTTPSTMSAFTATRRLARACDTLPAADADQAATGSSIPYFQEWITHEEYDTYWKQMDYRGNAAHLPPVVHLGGGWVDFFLPGVLDNYVALQDPQHTVRLLIGSVQHGRNMATRTYQRDTFALLDKAFGYPTRTEPPAVRLRITGRGHWRQEPSWPPAHRVTSWYAQPLGRLTQQPAPDSLPSRYRYDPRNPTPTIGGTAVGLRAGARDNRDVERRADVLTFTSDPLTTDLTVIGPVHATVHIRSTLVNTDVFVRLCDV